GSAAFQRLVHDPAVTDPLTASDAQVAAHADFYFQYNADRQVTRSQIASGQVFTFSYATSTFADDYNHWKRRSTTTRADGTQRIVYTNFIGGVLLTDFASGSDHWIEHHTFDANAHETQMANPSAVLGYNDTAADLNVSLHASSGLIQNVVYYSTTT